MVPDYQNTKYLLLTLQPVTTHICFIALARDHGTAWSVTLRSRNTGNSPTVSQLPLGMCAEPAYLQGGKNPCFKISQSKFSNNRKMWDETFEICLRASTIYWIYWDWNKGPLAFRKIYVVFLELFVHTRLRLPYSPWLPKGKQYGKNTNIWTTLLFLESWHFWFTCSKIIIRYFKIGMAWTNWQREQTLPFAIQGQALTC